MQQYIGQIKQSARVAVFFICILSLSGCPDNAQTQQDKTPHQVASAIMAQAADPLTSSNEKTNEEKNKEISQFSISFVNMLIKKDYKQAQRQLSPLLQKKYTDQKLEQNFSNILKQTGKNPKPVQQSIIIDKTMMTTDKNSVADVYLSIRGSKGAKAMYLGLCNNQSAQIKICHLGWGTEDSGEN